MSFVGSMYLSPYIIWCSVSFTTLPCSMNISRPLHILLFDWSPRVLCFAFISSLMYVSQLLYGSLYISGYDDYDLLCSWHVVAIGVFSSVATIVAFNKLVIKSLSILYL